MTMHYTYVVRYTGLRDTYKYNDTSNNKDNKENDNNSNDNSDN